VKHKAHLISAVLFPSLQQSRSFSFLPFPLTPLQLQPSRRLSKKRLSRQNPCLRKSLPLPRPRQRPQQPCHQPVNRRAVQRNRRCLYLTLSQHLCRRSRPEHTHCSAAGRLGVAPNISLTYSSLGGNGFLGVGWALIWAHTVQDQKRPVLPCNDLSFPRRLDLGACSHFRQ